MNEQKHNANYNGQKLLITVLFAFDIRSFTPFRFYEIRCAACEMCTETDFFLSFFQVETIKAFQSMYVY